MADLGSDAAGPSRPPLSRASQLAPPPRSQELSFSLASAASEGGLLLAPPSDAAPAASSSSAFPSAAPPARSRASKSPLPASEAQPQRAAPPSATHSELGPLPRSPRPPPSASAGALTLAARLRLPPRVFPRSTKPAAAAAKDVAVAPSASSDAAPHALTTENLQRAEKSQGASASGPPTESRNGEATGRGFMPPSDGTAVVSPPASTAGASTSGMRSPRMPSVPAWGAPRSWANLASTSNGISISVPASGSASAAASASASPSAPLSPASRRKKSSRSDQQAQKRPKLSLKEQLRAAERSFVAPLTRPRGMINTGNFCFANAVSRASLLLLCRYSDAARRSCKCLCTARPSRTCSP
jgi:ubiquitin carboxyl-terminal hydrolase 10